MPFHGTEHRFPGLSAEAFSRQSRPPDSVRVRTGPETGRQGRKFSSGQSGRNSTRNPAFPRGFPAVRAGVDEIGRPNMDGNGGRAWGLPPARRSPGGPARLGRLPRRQIATLDRQCQAGPRRKSCGSKTGANPPEIGRGHRSGLSNGWIGVGKVRPNCPPGHLGHHFSTLLAGKLLPNTGNQPSLARKSPRPFGLRGQVGNKVLGREVQSGTTSSGLSRRSPFHPRWLFPSWPFTSWR